MEDKINWFGTEKKKKEKRKVNSFQFLSESKPSSFNWLNKKPSRNSTGWLKNNKTNSRNLLFPGLRKKQQPISFMRPVAMANSLFKKNKSRNIRSSEDLLYSKTRLNRFGDWDMDGSPNAFDCSPKRVSKDGPISWLKKRAEAKRLKLKPATEYAEEPIQTAYQQRLIKKEKREALKEGIKDYRTMVKSEKEEEYRSKLMERGKEKLKQRYRNKYIQEEKQRTGKRKLSEKDLTKVEKRISKEELPRREIEAIEKRVARKKIVPFEAPFTVTREELIEREKQKTGKKKLSSEDLARIDKEFTEVTIALKEYVPPSAQKEIAAAQALGEKVAEAKEKAGEIIQFEEGGRYYGKKGKINLKEAAIAAKIEKGEKPSTAELESLYLAKKTYKETHPLEALKAGELPSIESVKTAVRRAEWDPSSTSFGRKISAMSAGMLGAFLPPGTLSGRKLSAASYPSGSKVGRPKGVYKNYIPGVGPVGIYEYRKWARQQRALQRIQGQLPEQSPEYQMQQQLMQQAQQLEPAKAGLNNQGNYDNSTYQAPQVYDTANLPPDQAKDIKTQQQNYQKVMFNRQYDKTMGELQTAHLHQPTKPALAVQAIAPQFKDARQVLQYQEQATDNVMYAPNIQRGDMVGTGTNPFTYTPPEGNILNAPNITMGQMRNIENKGRDIPAIRLSEKAIPNPEGEQYTDIDPMSGRVALKRRIEEKWLTGEAY